MRITAVPLAIGALALAALSAVAFKPDEIDHGHRFITEGVLLHGYSYGKLTVPVFTTTLSDGKEVRFSSIATSHVVLGNMSSDLPDVDFRVDGVEIDLDWEPFNPAAHCDNDLIEACAGLIRFRRTLVVNHLKAHLAGGGPRELGLARATLGRALHTLQDFYAHSNHADVQKGEQTFDALATGSVTPAGGAFTRSPGVAVCESRAPSGAWAIAPTFQNNGGNWRLTGAGTLDAADPGQTGKRYTTGWFITERTLLGLDAAPDGDSARCDHGYEHFGFPVSGISKDLPYSPLDTEPMSEMEARTQPTEIHARASHQAAKHTRALLELLIAEIRASDPVPSNQDSMIKALLGIDADTPIYGFVVDRSGSMASIIDGVKTQIQKMIDDGVASGGATSRKFMVVDFADPDVGKPVIGTAAEVKAYVEKLVATGGGDCPELAYTALQAAVTAAPKGSGLFVFTDASAKDTNLASQVLDAALSKSITLSFAVSGVCSPTDPSYVPIAQTTGGQVINTEHTSAGVAAAFTGISIDAANARSQPAVVESGTTGTPRIITIPLEDGASRLSVLATTASGTITFTGPGGAVVAGPGVTISDFIGGRGLKVDRPVAGTWTVTITPTTVGRYDVRADIAGTVNLAGVTFSSATPKGRAGHQGYMRYGSTPPLGKSRIEVALTGTGPFLPVFEAIATDGRVLSTLAMSRGPRELFLGTIDTGAASFRLRVRGRTPGGLDFTRVLPTLFSSTPFTMELVDVSQWASGLTGELRIQVNNHGADDTFRLTATAPAAGTVHGPSPGTIAIKSGAAAVASVKLAVAATAPLDTWHTLQTVITNSAGVARAYTHRFRLSADTDGDGVPDVIERGPAGADPTYDGNGDGIPDWRQANVASLYSRQKQGYVTLAVPGPARFASTSSIAPPPGSPGRMPLDVFDLRIAGVAPGGTVDMKIYLPTLLTASTIAKFGPEPGSVAPHWYDFRTDGKTGATVAGNLITVRLVDGARGDDDLAANGVIVGTVGPVEVVGATATPPAPPQPPTPAPTTVATAETSSSEATNTETAPRSGGGGGCTMDMTGRFDGALLVLLALALFARSRHRKAGPRARATAAAPHARESPQR